MGDRRGGARMECRLCERATEHDGRPLACLECGTVKPRPAPLSGRTVSVQIDVTAYDVRAPHGGTCRPVQHAIARVLSVPVWSVGVRPDYVGIGCHRVPAPNAAFALDTHHLFGGALGPWDGETSFELDVPEEVAGGPTHKEDAK